MFWLSRCTYSGVPGVGPAAHTLPAPKPAVRIPAIANATVALIRLPMVFLPQLVVPRVPRRPRQPLPSRRGPNASKPPARNQDTTVLCLDIVRRRSLVLARPSQTAPRAPARGSVDGRPGEGGAGHGPAAVQLLPGLPGRPEHHDPLPVHPGRERRVRAPVGHARRGRGSAPRRPGCPEARRPRRPGW